MRSILFALVAILVIAIPVFYFRSDIQGILYETELLKKSTLSCPMDHVNVCGKIFSENKIPGLPDAIMTNVFVAAVPKDKLSTLLKYSGDIIPGNSLESLNFGVWNEEAANLYITQASKTNIYGEYTLSLPPGNYLLCLDNIEQRKKDVFLPAFITGCVEIPEIINGSEIVRDISWGVEGAR